MTILIVGGMAQGKREFARRLSPETEMIDNLQDIVRQALDTGKPVPQASEFLGKTVICTELGCGIVPMDAEEREWREQTGRLCCDLAAQADRVYRVSCGIAQCIKGAS